MTNTHTVHGDGFMSAVQPLCETQPLATLEGFIYFVSVLSSAIPEFENETRKFERDIDWRLDVPGGIRGRKHAAAAAGSGMRAQAKDNRRFGEGWDRPETGPAESDSPKG